ncbi:hypothetical protein [Gemella morbillorum]|uniref:hypothetical protein n=1 Tax=Gemella morbillorum TaxID=29391 RepID=UPI00248DAB98|nr:hypothetical protein [Gemella morbillorum]
MLNGLFVIFFIVVILIFYTISVCFSMIMFDMFGIKTSLAFIPFYNTYLVYKEYKGRVWKKNWGVLYAGTLIFSLLIIISVVTYIILVDDLMGINIYALLLSVATLLVLGIVSIMTNVVIPITLYYPIFETKFQKIILALTIVVTEIKLLRDIFKNDSALVEYGQVDAIGAILNITAFIISIIFIVTYLTAASNMRYKVKSGEYVLQEKLDYNLLSSDEINTILQQRGRRLAVLNKDNKRFIHSNAVQKGNQVNEINYI